MGKQNGAKSPSLLWQTGNAPDPLVAVAVGSGGLPVLVEISPWFVRVTTDAVTSLGAPDMSVGVPLMVVWTGVMVLGLPDSSTVTHGSVASAGALATLEGAGIAATVPRNSHAAASVDLDACIVKGVGGARDCVPIEPGKGVGMLSKRMEGRIRGPRTSDLVDQTVE